MGYLRPCSIEEAVAALAAGPAVPLAGGTDYFPARVAHMPDERVLDLSGISALRDIAVADGVVRIGALATWSDLLRADLPPAFDALTLAAREVGGAQIQNTGTLAGNICNASPAADGVPGLLALDARVELAGPRGVRVLQVADFVLGNRRTARAADEIVTAIVVPVPVLPARGTFLKLGARKYLVISIVMVAAVAEHDGERLAALRIAVGAAGPRAVRLPDAEVAALRGDAIEAAHLAPLTPIDDVRGSAAYRLDAALTLVRRAVDQVRP
jgi:CO/xanthine dehydrogenase FAD-binding subunit